MATRAEIDAYQSVIDGLSTVATAQIRNLLVELDNPNPITFRDALLATYPELMAPYMSAAGEVAAQWYMELRAQAGVTAPYVAVAAVGASSEQLQAGLRYSLSPLFQPQKFLGSDVLSLLAGFSQKMIVNVGRDTVSGNAGLDRVRVRYARVPRLGCCSFCALLASRGAVYRSPESAGVVLGRGVDAELTRGKRGGQGQGTKTRGSQALGDRFHDNCRCTVAPKFPGEDNDYLDYTADFYLDQYRQVASNRPAAYAKKNPAAVDVGARDLDATLAEWRRTFGTK